MKNTYFILLIISAALIGLYIGIFIGHQNIDGAITVQVEETDDENKLLELNAAKYSELAAIPSISPAMARKIIAYREDNGPFENVYDLLNIEGFSYDLLEKIIDYVYIK